MNQCVILAGGLGTRMWPEAKSIPKTLLPVAGVPFATFQLEWLSAAGIDSVVYCVGHLGSMVSDFVGDGERWNLEIQYVYETDELLGTAGALRLAVDEGALSDDFLVLYGDSWLQVDPLMTLQDARSRPQPALMTAFRNEGRWDTSNVELADGLVLRYAKNVTPVPESMQWIDYGLLAFRRDLIIDRVRPGVWSDLAPLCSALAEEHQLAGAEVFERFYEVGSPDGRIELEELLSGRHNPAQQLDGPSDNS